VKLIRDPERVPLRRTPHSRPDPKEGASERHRLRPGVYWLPGCSSDLQLRIALYELQIKIHLTAGRELGCVSKQASLTRRNAGHPRASTDLAIVSERGAGQRGHDHDSPLDSGPCIRVWIERHAKAV
jgi:hypothetical protein